MLYDTVGIDRFDEMRDWTGLSDNSETENKNSSCSKLAQAHRTAVTTKGRES